jgi:hypothetical protein
MFIHQNEESVKVETEKHSLEASHPSIPPSTGGILATYTKERRDDTRTVPTNPRT